MSGDGMHGERLARELASVRVAWFRGEATYADAAAFEAALDSIASAAGEKTRLALPGTLVRGRAYRVTRAFRNAQPGTISPAESESRGLLGLASAPQMLITTESFGHTGDSREVPSKSKTYSSLARAIASGDAGKFTPGRPNTDFRSHLSRSG